MDNSIGFVAALIAGLAGSGHCLAMCGGMAGALGLRSAAGGAGASKRWRNAALYHLGRVGGYGVAGALCGFLGSGVSSGPQVPIVTTTVRIASGLLLILIAARMSLRWNVLNKLEQLGARVWGALRPIAVRQATRADATSALALGFLWGWLPCGLVYSMLLFAALSQSVVGGSGIMAAYGIGTVPAMLGATLFAGQAQRWLQAPGLRLASALLLVGFGSWTIYAAILPVHSLAHSH